MASILSFKTIYRILSFHIQLLALVLASEARPPQADANRLAEGNEIVLRELQRRLTEDGS